ncbi:hypothetical protein C8F04DRAFT_1264564 [Mycena alexandri]|uniref:Uncharacterized protein n=1 Tax=Mycena alexandri TaxID=1745969 RepID=A0AAD6SKV5_9AGAR|nr:hypothetical protein C8F04DRAFT_1264564 [Mycena alexandri]
MPPPNPCRDLVLYIPVWKCANLQLGERYCNVDLQLQIAQEREQINSEDDEDFDEMPSLEECVTY